MLSFGFIAGLLGLFAIAMPVILHLLKPQQEQPVWFAQVQLLQRLVNHTSRHGIERWILLLLRILIVVVATMLMAQSVWRSDASGAEPVRLAVVTPHWLMYSTDEQIDAMVKANDDVVILNHDLSPANLSKSAVDIEPTKLHVSYWSRLAQLDRIKPAHYQFVVYGINQLSLWDQTYRPALSRSIEWQLSEVKHQSQSQSQSNQSQLIAEQQLMSKVNPQLYPTQNVVRQSLAPYLLWLLVLLWGLERCITQFGLKLKKAAR